MQPNPINIQNSRHVHLVIGIMSLTNRIMSLTNRKDKHVLGHSLGSLSPNDMAANQSTRTVQRPLICPRGFTFAFGMASWVHLAGQTSTPRPRYWPGKGARESGRSNGFCRGSMSWRLLLRGSSAFTSHSFVISCEMCVLTPSRYLAS
jgi:hypothetical protein